MEGCSGDNDKSAEEVLPVEGCGREFGDRGGGLLEGPERGEGCGVEDQHAVQVLTEVGYTLRKSGGGQASILVHQLPAKGLSFQLWPAASALCWYLEEQYGTTGMWVRSSQSVDECDSLLPSKGTVGSSDRRMRVLELGAGTGMVGVLAARLGAQVVLTDLPHVISNLEHNIQLNLSSVRAAGGSLDVQPVRWGVEEDIPTVGDPFDLIIASDVVYYDTLFEPLLKTLKWLVWGRETVNIPKTPAKHSQRVPHSFSGQTEAQVSGIVSGKVSTSANGVSTSENPRTESLRFRSHGWKTESQKEESCLPPVDPSLGPVVLLAHLRRWKKDAHFFRMASKYFNVHVVHRHAPTQNSRTGVVVYHFTRRGISI